MENEDWERTFGLCSRSGHFGLLLLHDQKQRVVVAQAGGVESGREGSGVLVQSIRQKRHRSREGPVYSDHVGVGRYSLGRFPKMTANRVH